MKPPAISLEEILQIGEPLLRIPIPEAYRDSNGHMNVRWYVGIFDDASDVLHDDLGLTVDYHARNGTGTFDLEHHIQYLSEAMPGERAAVYVRYLAGGAKRLHYIMFLVNETQARLSATLECINAFADLRVRRTAPWPEEAATKITQRVQDGKRLAWAAPVCGVMGV